MSSRKGLYKAFVVTIGVDAATVTGISHTDERGVLEGTWAGHLLDLPEYLETILPPAETKLRVVVEYPPLGISASSKVVRFAANLVAAHIKARHPKTKIIRVTPTQWQALAHYGQTAEDPKERSLAVARELGVDGITDHEADAVCMLLWASDLD